MSVKLLTENRLEFLNLKGGCRGSSESTHVKMQHCWKSHALAHYYYVSSLFRFYAISCKCTLGITPRDDRSQITRKSVLIVWKPRKTQTNCLATRTSYNLQVKMLVEPI